VDPLILQAARELKGARKTVALTGAGISVESGIPPFRGKGGIWERIDPMEYAHIDRFMSDPARVWEVLIKGMTEVLERAEPNAAHHGLVRLERLGLLQTVITQNVDGLHQAAGNTDVIEFHGNFAWQRCIRCNGRLESAGIDLSTLPPRCSCGGVLRPECIFFGEMIPPLALKRSHSVSAGCDLMLVIGTSAWVQPAATMPFVAKQSGARIIEINREATPLTASVSDFLLQGKAGEVMEALVEAVETLPSRC
jgi:NAD-dependent deacetylase